MQIGEDFMGGRVGGEPSPWKLEVLTPTACGCDLCVSRSVKMRSGAPQI